MQKLGGRQPYSSPMATNIIFRILKENSFARFVLPTDEHYTNNFQNVGISCVFIFHQLRIIFHSYEMQYYNQL